MGEVTDLGRDTEEAENKQVTPESTALQGQPASLVTCQRQVGILV